MDDNGSAAAEDTVPTIQLPDLSPPTPEEIERRREPFKRTIAHRDAIEPIRVRTEDLIHELRGGDDRFDG